MVAILSVETLDPPGQRLDSGNILRPAGKLSLLEIGQQSKSNIPDPAAAPKRFEMLAQLVRSIRLGHKAGYGYEGRSALGHPAAQLHARQHGGGNPLNRQPFNQRAQQAKQRQI